MKIRVHDSADLDGLVALKEFASDRVSMISDTKVFYDPTPAGRAVLDSVPGERIPQVSGRVLRPWLEK
jgi:hypothetical protein